METLEKNGTIYVLVPREAWQKISSGDVVMPELPPAAADGSRPALETARVIIARGIIHDRLALGWTQAELARQSGVRVDGCNRIERAGVRGDQPTIERIEKALRPPARRKKLPSIIGPHRRAAAK